ncbi:obscurin-like isoform X1 [Ostrinia nubilalis]|uniref:obscurin-like isoform X1 n=1 Tax=Ostrinia nubilalis TaxID=29057 RepID=UPI0030825957
MTQEEIYTRLDDDLHSAAEHAADDEDLVIRRQKSVKEMILRFEKTSLSAFDPTNDSLERSKDSSLGSLTSVVNPLQMHFQHLCPVTRSQDRNSNVSVNSILSNASENSYESSSSGFVSDRKSGRESLVPHRPAPPPPEPFNDSCSSSESKSPVRRESREVERRYSSATPNSSPIVKRRSRQPPVMRKKSNASSILLGEAHWSYGVRQSDLEKLLGLKRSEVSDHEDDRKSISVESENESSSGSSSDSNDSEKSNKCNEYIVQDDDGRTDTLSTDHSTDTLINEENSDEQDDLSVTSGESGERSNYDNVSIKSISSFDMVPYQKYDSITVSSDEFGSELCSAPDTEFLTVSAVNEWCMSRSVAPTLLPVQSKKEKYRRRLTERVNELIHTESVYVERLRHVIENYIPEMDREDLPSTLAGAKGIIFANIEDVYRFHSKEFLPALRECENDLRKLGQCFRIYEPRFNMYVMYSRHNKRATRLIYEHKLFFQEKQMELGERLDLSSYILEPIQRIPRYKLFLVDLVKTYTNYENERCESDSRISKLSVDSDETGGSNGDSDSDETPLESLKQAKIVVERILTAVDEIVVLENITDLPPQLSLLCQGRLLVQNEFWAMDTARRRRTLMRLFLFDKLVLITAVYKKHQRLEYYIYKDHIQVEDLGITAKENDVLKFTIWYKNRNLKSYKLENKDPAVRTAWVEEITSLLWEQAMKKKELLLEQRQKRMSVASQQSSEDDKNDDKYNSLRGVPGEVNRSGEKKTRRTTWYCE